MDTIFYIFHVRTTAPPRLARWSSERTFAKISQSRKKLLPGPSPGLLKAPTSTFIYKTLFLLWIWINASLAKCLKRFLNVEAVVASLNQLKALVGAFSLIVKTSRRFVASSTSPAPAILVRQQIIKGQLGLTTHHPPVAAASRRLFAGK